MLCFAALAWPGVTAAQPPPSAPIVYGGDEAFPPYEYLDEDGRPDGFNVRLVQALAQSAGVAVEFSLMPRGRLVEALDNHLIDLATRAQRPGRAGEFAQLIQTWTLEQVVIVRPRPGGQPARLLDLGGYTVAVESGTINDEALSALPPDHSPTLLRVASRREVVAAFVGGRADGMAGNGLTLASLAPAAVAGLPKLPITSSRYYLVTWAGDEARVAPLIDAFPALRASGAFDRLVERYLTVGVGPSWMERNRRPLAAVAVLVALLFVGGTAWNRSLQRQVRARTEAVQQSERRYRELVTNASDMIYRTDPTGHFTLVNPVAARLLGYTESELLGMRYIALIRPDWVARAMQFYQAAARSHDSTYLEFPVRTKDGGELWVGQHVRPIIEGGRLVGFDGVARDVTDRVRARGELQAERDFVSAVLDTAPSLVIVLDVDGTIVRFNRACETLSGVSEEAAIGRPMWEMPFLLEGDRHQIREGLAQLAGSTTPVPLDRVWVDPQGHRHVIAWTAIPLREASGVATNIIGVGTDVTHTRELERLKSQFVSMVSHELRTPLTSIRASMQLMLDADHAGRDPEADQLVRVALTNAERLIRIVNDILDMSKIEAGEIRVSPRPLPVTPIVQESVRAVVGVARDATVTIAESIEEGLPDAMVDPDRTIQVLVNLISNAVKHSPAGGRVEVEARREGPFVAIAVRDHGPGIPAAMLGFIFEPFTQLDGSDARRIPGTGLGLTIARALAEKQGGAVRVTSVEGEGATFTATLPVA